MRDDELANAIENEIRQFQEQYRWLEENMPGRFFEQVSRETITLIVHNLVGFKQQNYFAQIQLPSGAIVICLDSPDADLKVLSLFTLHGIKHYRTYLSRAAFPCSKKNLFLRVATVYFTEVVETRIEHISQESLENIRQLIKERNPKVSDKEIDILTKRMNTRFLKSLPMDRIALALDMFFRAKSRDHCQYEVRFNDNWAQVERQHSMDIVFAWRNTPKYNFLYRIAEVVHRHGLTMQRANATYVDPYHKNSILIMGLGLHGHNGKAAWEVANIRDFLQELVMVKYFESFDTIHDVFVASGLTTGNIGNFIRTIITFTHQILTQLDTNLYSYENIQEALCRHPELTVKICYAFEKKFHPKESNIGEYRKVTEEILELIQKLDTGHEVNDTRRKNVMQQSLNFIEHTLKTNFYCTNKTALSFRLDPNYLDHVPFNREEKYPELPYSVFFIKGMFYFGFHIRFKDLARGGLRTIFPDQMERMLAERSHVFNECYNLSYTQHKKNKDIPEGGAKGVIFLEPYARLNMEIQVLENELNDSGVSQVEMQEILDNHVKEQKGEYLYQTQRSFIYSLLALINCHPDGSLKTKGVVDYWKKPEYIYLGPDELMHNNMIEWISQHSKDYDYKPGRAFITGKPNMGINHKEFGVTSLGVNVYMHEVLCFLGIDPSTDPFTIKITGGPDGDVAGNQIRNLYTYYPKTAKLLALTDGSGTIYDPEGLNLELLVGMFHEQKAIAEYPPDEIHEGGYLLCIHEKQDVGDYAQKTLCWRKENGVLQKEWLSGSEMNYLYRSNVHQIVTDIFVPAGGRPRTLNDDNYIEFLDERGFPSCRAIVEGANLYLTPWARQKLEALGVLIVKDSSANKCGVICSSYEVLSGLILDEDEFKKEKDTIVEEIKEVLRLRALEEAQLILKTHAETGKPLTEISDHISKKINSFTDQLLEYLDTVELPSNPDNPMIQCFLNYCLPLLKTKYKDRLLKEIPENHKKAIIACRLAAQLVYQKGLDWYPSVIDVLPILLEDSDVFT